MNLTEIKNSYENTSKLNINVNQPSQQKTEAKGNNSYDDIISDLQI